VPRQGDSQFTQGEVSHSTWAGLWDYGVRYFLAMLLRGLAR
jgi:hypothetical protein